MIVNLGNLGATGWPSSPCATDLALNLLLVHSPAMSGASVGPSPSSRTHEVLLTELDRRFRGPLLAYFGRRVSSAAEAEDLTQDVFERVLRIVGSSPIHNAEALVFRIAVNLLRDRARSVRRRGINEPLPADSVSELADALTVDLSPERVVLGERTLAEVVKLLDELAPRTRAIFYLYRMEHLKMREIAGFYGISVSAAEKQVAKALVHLMRGLHRK
jgi:RNA polymerase sigma factor (sigma-70 family)